MARTGHNAYLCLALQCTLTPCHGYEISVLIYQTAAIAKHTNVVPDTQLVRNNRNMKHQLVPLKRQI